MLTIFASLAHDCMLAIFYFPDDRDENQDVDLAEEHKFKSYAPIVSFYAAAPDRFTDVPYPSSEDWEAACGKVFAHTFQHTKNETTGEIEMNGNPRYVVASLLCIFARNSSLTIWLYFSCSDLFMEDNFRKFERSWDDGRVATAFFRGTAT